MSEIPNLWPADFAPVEETLPITVLKKQAASLGDITSGNLEGKVINRGSGPGNVVNEFMIVAPALGGYTHRLLYVAHGINPYPANMFVDTNNTTYTIENEKQLIETMGIVLASQEVRKLIGSLISQVKATNS